MDPASIMFTMSSGIYLVFSSILLLTLRSGRTLVSCKMRCQCEAKCWLWHQRSINAGVGRIGLLRRRGLGLTSEGRR